MGNQVITDSTLPRQSRPGEDPRESDRWYAFSLDMHTKDAGAAGQTAQRRSSSPEKGTRIAIASGITDDAWTNAGMHFDDDQFAALVSQIVIINAFKKAQGLGSAASGYGKK